MNIDICKISINYKHFLENATIRISIKLFLKRQWYRLMRYLLITVQCHPELMWLSKIPVQENYSVYLLKFWIPKGNFLPARWALLNQSTRQSDQAVYYGQVLKGGYDIQKSTNGLRNLLIVGFYNILRLCSLKLPMIALKFILMVTLNHRYFQNVYYKCLFGNFIIAWYVPTKKLDLRGERGRK